MHTKWERWRKGLAESDARVNLRRHGAAAAGTGTRFCYTGIDKQMHIPKEEAPTKGRNERKKCQAGGMVTTETERRRDGCRQRDVLHEAWPMLKGR
jgi:hypothetical protein